MTTEFNFSVISGAKCRNVEPVTRMQRSGQELDDLSQNEAGKVPESACLLPMVWSLGHLW